MACSEIPTHRCTTPQYWVVEEQRTYFVHCPYCPYSTLCKYSTFNLMWHTKKIVVHRWPLLYLYITGMKIPRLSFPFISPLRCWYYIVRTCTYRHTFLYLYIFTTPQVASDLVQLNIRFSCNQYSVSVFPHTTYCHKSRTTFVKLISISFRYGRAPFNSYFWKLKTTKN